MSNSTQKENTFYQDHLLPTSLTDKAFVSEFGIPVNANDPASLYHIPRTTLFVTNTQSGTWTLLRASMGEGHRLIVVKSLAPFENISEGSELRTAKHTLIHTLPTKHTPWEDLINDLNLQEIVHVLTNYMYGIHQTSFQAHMNQMQYQQYRHLNEDYGSLFSNPVFNYGSHLDSSHHRASPFGFEEYTQHNIKERARQKQKMSGDEPFSSHQHDLNRLSNKEIALESLKKLTNIESLLTVLITELETEKEPAVELNETPNLDTGMDYESARYKVTEYMSLIETIKDVVLGGDSIAIDLLRVTLNDEKLSGILDRYLAEKEKPGQ